MYELAYSTDEETTYYDRYDSFESAVRASHNLAFSGFSNVVTNVEDGTVVSEVVVYS